MFDCANFCLHELILVKVMYVRYNGLSIKINDILISG